MYDLLSPDDLARENPKIRALVGRALSQLDARHREKARENFKHAEGLGFHDIFMMRSWYHLEFTSEYGLPEAERICEKVIRDAKYGSKFKSEFWSKFGSRMFMRANGVISVNRTKGLEFLRKSIISYLEAIWIGKNVKDMDISDTFDWLEKPLRRFALACKGDVDEFYLLFDNLVDDRHDVDVAAIKVILSHLSKFPAPKERDAQARFSGVCRKSINKINRMMRPLPSYPGFVKIVETLQALTSHFESKK